jgi:hypothetical protein
MTHLSGDKTVAKMGHPMVVVRSDWATRRSRCTRMIFYARSGKRSPGQKTGYADVESKLRFPHLHSIDDADENRIFSENLEPPVINRGRSSAI